MADGNAPMDSSLAIYLFLALYFPEDAIESRFWPSERAKAAMEAVERMCGCTIKKQENLRDNRWQVRRRRVLKDVQ